MTEPNPSTTLYEEIGGDPALRHWVNRFYDLMDREPEFVALRALHGRDLTLARAKLGDWLSGWLGGPALYASRSDAMCIGHAHAAFKIDQQLHDDWLRCIYRALDDSPIARATQDRLRPPLAALAGFLRNH
jgi:hemoglobin